MLIDNPGSSTFSFKISWNFASQLRTLKEFAFYEALHYLRMHLMANANVVSKYRRVFQAVCDTEKTEILKVEISCCTLRDAVRDDQFRTTRCFSLQSLQH
jgi:hypothetical protein